jgi:hypothetical protein
MTGSLVKVVWPTLIFLDSSDFSPIKGIVVLSISYTFFITFPFNIKIAIYDK